MAVLVIATVALIRCTGNDARKYSPVRFDQFAGSAKCASCHKQQYEDHLKSFHHLTSSFASLETVKGHFSADSNRFYFHPGLYVAAETADSGLVQAVYQNGMKVMERPFDLSVGSAKRGQTYLYWRDDYIFQLPLSYFTMTDEWTNSPGYGNRVQFNRPATARCLECHSTYFQQLPGIEKQPDRFSRTNLILGVECEKCHGPGAEHVAFYEKKPADTSGKYVVNPAKLTRDLSLDLCRSCHGGRLEKTAPSFSFVAGDRLADHFIVDSNGVDPEGIDVHGNQYGLMSASKCFTQSKMTCLTCHDPHKNEVRQTEVFTSRCSSCHGSNTHTVCKMKNSIPGILLNKYCIDCHMPEKPSRTISVLRQGESIPTSAIMRSHYIAVYRDETRKILEKEAQLSRAANK